MVSRAEKIKNHFRFPLFIHKQPIAGAADMALAKLFHVTLSSSISAVELYTFAVPFATAAWVSSNIRKYQHHYTAKGAKI
jgi:hypothetical protein